MERFDSDNGNGKNKGCKVGSSFLIKMGQNLAVRSYMCEDGATGGTYLMRLRKWQDGAQCPVEITPIEKTLIW